MSKIRVHENGKTLKIVDNKIMELNEDIVIVRTTHVNELEKHNIPYSKFVDDFFLVKRGKKKKRFNEDEAKKIKQDLDNNLSIRKCADKYKCSTSIVQSIKKGTY